MTHVTCRLTAKNRDQLRNPTLGNRIWPTFTFTILCEYVRATIRYVGQKLAMRGKRPTRGLLVATVANSLDDCCACALRTRLVNRKSISAQHQLPTVFVTFPSRRVNKVMVNKCQVSFGFLPAKSKKLIRTVIAFCRSLLCLKTAYENSLSEANYKQVREYWSNTYMLQYFWLVTMLQKNEKKLSFCGAPFLWGPLFGRTC